MLTYNVLNEYVERLKKQDMPVMATTDNITNLTGDDINKLRVGDVVVKQTGNMKHLYLVTYKEENVGICISYFAAGYSETVSYDCIDGVWTYNSTDIVEEQAKLTAGDNITISGNTISATDTTYTAGDNITITDGVISASGGKYYMHQLNLRNHRTDYLGEFHCTIISQDASAYTKAQIENIFKTYFNSYDKSKIGIGRYRPNTTSDFTLIYDMYHDASQSKYYYRDVLTDTQVEFSVSNTNDNVVEIKSFIE